MPYQSRHAGQLADLLMRQGEIEGSRAQNRGSTLASLIQGLASIPAGIHQDRAAQAQAQQQQRLLDSRLATEDLSRRNVQGQIDERGYKQMDAVAEKDEAETAKKGAEWFIAVASAPDPETKKAVYKAGREALIAEGRMQPSETPDFYPGDSWLKLTVAQRFPELGKQMFPQRNLHNVPAGTTVIDQNNPGAGPVFTAEPKAPDAPAVGSFEDFVVRKFGPQPTPDQIAEARKVYQQADDRPININTRELTPNAQLDATLKLRDRFTRETSAAQTVKMQLELMKSSLAAVKAGAAAPGSQGVLVTFQKILDPTSVVRESEYARSASGLSLLSRIEGKWQTIEKGGAGVPVKDLEEFVALGEQFMRNQVKAANETKAQIDSIARQFKLDPSQITRDIGGSGTVRMRAPNGQEADVPADQVEAAKAKGATVIR